MASPLEDMVDEILDYIDTCKPAGFSGNYIKVNRDEIVNLLDELKSKTPEEIRRYQKIINQEKAIIANAEKKAADIIAKAQIKTEELVSDHKILQKAYDEAKNIVNEAVQRAQDILDKATMESNAYRESAVNYTDSMLKVIQEVLVRSMDTTRMTSEAFLNEMKGYYETVVSNRMQLSPSPEEVLMESPQPQAMDVQQPAVNTAAASAGTASQTEAKVQRQVVPANTAVRTTATLKNADSQKVKKQDTAARSAKNRVGKN